MAKTTRHYAIYDVFSDTALAGNPLAIVFDSAGLEGEKMQRIAAEFNLSETAFILPPEDKNHMARLRIFMPKGELPFAGHPTVGSTVALCECQDANISGPILLEEKVGLVRCAYRAGDVGFAQFDLPMLPVRQTHHLTNEQVAQALGLSESDIGFENHSVSQFNAGNPFLCVPINALDAVQNARFNEQLWLSFFPDVAPINVICPYIYCRQTVHAHANIHARLFAPHHGIPEDPATGSAVASLSGALTLFDDLPDGATHYVIEQGVEMGRPSIIQLEIDTDGDTLQAARIGGHAVKIAQGILSI